MNNIMITNIFLGLILGIVITSFIILNNKLNKLITLLGKLSDADLSLNTNFTDSLQILKKLTDLLVDHRLKETTRHADVISTIERNIERLYKEIDNVQDSAYKIPVRLETFIANESNTIITEIKKQAKISSKIKSKSKMNNNINKQ